MGYDAVMDHFMEYTYRIIEQWREGKQKAAGILVTTGGTKVEARRGVEDGGKNGNHLCALIFP